MCLSQTGLLFGSLSSWMAANLVWCKDFAEDVGSECSAGKAWGFLDPWDVVGLRTTASVWNVPKKYGP